jgi:hypothetical protein
MIDIRDKDGNKVISYECMDKMRQADMNKATPSAYYAQRGCQEIFLSSSADIVIVGGSRGCSKAQPYYSKVCTPFGFKPIGDLRVGDMINDTMGSIQNVICITEWGVKPIYRLKFSDGTFTDCTEDHLWNIKRTNLITKKRKNNGGGQEMDWRTWTFSMIKDFLDNQGNAKKSQYDSHLLIPLSEPIKFTRAVNGWAPTINPYVIGAIIGDGCVSEIATEHGVIIFTSADEEIVNQFVSAGISMDSSYKKQASEAKDYRIKCADLYNQLYEMGLIGCVSNSKFIPSYYKTAPLDERIALIQGMMDTDGCCSSKGRLTYTTVSETLAYDMRYMLESIGSSVTIIKHEAGYKKDGEYIRCQDAYTLCIKIANKERLFRLSRKRELCKEYNGDVSIPCRRIVGYEFVGYEKCRCIAVSNPNALYITDDFIVTHNSFSLLMETLKDIYNPRFNAIILRNEKGDLESLTKDAPLLYSQFGTYNKSLNDMTWNFYKGGSLRFTFYEGDYEDFKKRFQGKQYPYIGIDEITHMPYNKFKYIITDSRNAYGIRNRIYGTCNPDPDSWVRGFIAWWIGEDGLPIPERSGVVRYCFMDGDSPSGIYWGNTREEVYLQCKDTIDRLWKPAYGELGFDKLKMFIKSATFIKGNVEENIKLITSDPSYVANLAQQGEEQRARDLEGNWNYKAIGDDMIKMTDLEAMYEQAQMIGDGIKRVSCDVAFDGGDSLVMWLWTGWHITDIAVFKLDPKNTVNAVRAQLTEWGVTDEHFTYDLQGVGQTLKGWFQKAVPFNNQEAVDEKEKNLYGNLKSQCAYLFTKKIYEREISINPRLLDLKFSGKGFEKMPLRQVLMKERKCVRKDESKVDKGFYIIGKDKMKKFVGHSPDFFEALIMRMIFDVKAKKITKPKGIWRI